MKSLCPVLLCLLMAFSSHAQEFKKLPSFGEVSTAELKMTECAFDKGAPAMVIFDEGESFFSINYNTTGNPFYEETVRRVRIKIFNTKGFAYGSIKIRYRSEAGSTISIKNFGAQTYNLDDAGNVKVTKVERNAIYDKKLNKFFSEKTFVFADLKPGSVLEYKYTLDGGTEWSWAFQKEIPVMYSRFVVDFPQELEVSVTPYCTLPYVRSGDKNRSDNYSWYAMENVPALDDEPFMSCRKDYVQRLAMRLIAVQFLGQPRRNLLRSWPGIIKQLMEDQDFGVQLKKDIPRTADLDAMLKDEKDIHKRIAIIHNYVRKNMEWNNYDNIWALDGVKSAWKDKKGTSGEINLILINLLKDAGITVHPVLVSTRDNGTVNTGIADYNQFDKVMAYVETADRVYVLDATDKATPTHLIPESVMYSEGLVIEKISTYEWGWKTIWDGKYAYTRNVFLNGEADANGNVKGFATVTASDYERQSLLPGGKGDTLQIKKEYEAINGLKLERLEFANVDTDSLPLVENIGFENKGSSSGEYKYFTVNLFTGLEKNPFIADERKTDIFYGANQHYDLSGTIFLPDGYVMEEVPKSMRMLMPDSSISLVRQVSFDAGSSMLSFRYKIDFMQPVYLKNDYDYFMEFYKKMIAVLDEKFVYKKK
jgi:hypothetical protein